MSVFKEWLLSPKTVGTSVEAKKSWRVNSHIIFSMLEEVIFADTAPALNDYSTQLRQDCSDVLTALGVLGDSSYTTYVISDYRHAWMNCDYDWFHARFLTIPAYAEMISLVRAQDWDNFQGYHGCYLTLARRIGQVARIDGNRTLMVGDRPVSKDNLIGALELGLTSVGDTISVYNLCRVLCPGLGVTPARLEMALLNLRADWSHFPFEIAGSSRREPGTDETVVRFTMDGYRFDTVSSGKFGMATDIGTVAFKKVN